MTDEFRYAAAWRDHSRRMAVFRTIQLLLFPMILGAAFISSKYPCAYQISMSQALVAMSTWFLAYMAAGIWLNRFRCPRCGKRYYWRVEWKGAAERQKKWRDCRHLRPSARFGARSCRGLFLVFNPSRWSASILFPQRYFCRA